VKTSSYGNMRQLLETPANYTAFGQLLVYDSPTSNAFWLDTASAQTAHGAKGFFGAINMYSTLGVAGLATLSAGASVTGAVTASGVVSGVGVKVATTDTVTAAAVGTFCYKTSDSTMYVKIRMTGTTGARWKKLY
jgi:hypothetical protein